MAEKKTRSKKTTLPENEQPVEQAVPEPQAAPAAGEAAHDEQVDLTEEFAALGRKFGEAFHTAWNSQERENIEKELRAGLRRFGDEVDEALVKVRASDPGKKVEEGVKTVRDEVSSSKVSGEVRRGMVTALRSLSDALEKMASSFTPAEGDGAKKDTPPKG